MTQPGSPISPPSCAWRATKYAAPFSYIDEGKTTLYYRSRDNDRNQEAPNSRDFKVDTHPPEVVVTAAATYSRVAAFTVAFSATDPVPGSGVTSVTGTFDGDAATNGQAVDLLFLALGKHTVLATAVDAAGLTATKAITFEIIATIHDLPVEIRELRRRGDIDSDGTMKSLLAKAENALKSFQSGRRTPTINQLQALLNELNAQLGNHLTARGATLLIGDVNFVIDHLP